MLQIILRFLKKLYFSKNKMTKKIEAGFTLVEVMVTAVIIVFITGAIFYGILSVNYSIRNAELNQTAFNTLSNKMEELKSQVVYSCV